MELLIPIVGLFIGYILNNYILTVNEDEKGEFLKPNFDKKRTLIILLWNSLIPLILFKMYGNTFSVMFFRDVTLSALCSAVFFIDFRLCSNGEKNKVLDYFHGVIAVLSATEEIVEKNLHIFLPKNMELERE